MDLFMYKEEMLSLMESVQIQQQKYTFSQIMQNLRRYVTVKKLLSPSDPTLILLGNDPLACLIGSSTFDLKKTPDRNKLVLLMTRHLEQCRPNAALPSTTDENCRGQGIKRKISATDFDDPDSPMYLHIPPSPVYDSGKETSYSVQDYPTDEARNSGSSFSNCESDDCGGYIPDESELLHNIPKMVENVIKCLEQQCPLESESDVPFWADCSNSDWCSDLESISTGKWQCGKCNVWNECGRKDCHGCSLSAVWKRKRRKKLLSKSQRQRMRQAEDFATQESTKSSQESGTTEDGVEEQDKCILCVNRNANALILHGKTAHNTCCYACARKLQRFPHTCPTCRREIDRVVHLL